METPSSPRIRLATAPAATRAAVSRADARSRMSRASVRRYFSTPTRSAWPGRGRWTLRSSRSPAPADGGSGAIAVRQFSQSRFQTSMAMGAPIVSPSRTPARSSARSSSIAIRPPRPYPPCRRRSSGSMSRSATRAKPAGTPSTRDTRPRPWDSPAVLNVNRIRGSSPVGSQNRYNGPGSAPQPGRPAGPGCPGTAPDAASGGKPKPPSAHDPPFGLARVPRTRPTGRCAA